MTKLEVVLVALLLVSLVALWKAYKAIHSMGLELIKMNQRYVTLLQIVERERGS